MVAKKRKRSKSSATEFVRPFYTKIRGVTAENEDGTCRQNLVKRCKPGQTLVLVRDPKNRYDRNAIKVCSKRRIFRRSQQLGFISAELAEEMAPEIDSGRMFFVEVVQVTGGGFLWWRKPFGLNVKITPSPSLEQ